MHEIGTPIKVLIVDDQRMFAESLARLLAAEDDIEVVGVESSGPAAVATARLTDPHVVLMDYHLPGQDGVSITTELKRIRPDTMVIMLTGEGDDRVLLAAIEAGCSGYMTKDRAAAEVTDAVRAAAAGEAVISADVLARLLPKLNRTHRSMGDDLTERERDTLGFLAEGLSNKAIAARMNLSVNTVRNYVQSILTKLGAHSKLEAVATAVREGIIDYLSRG